MRVRGAGREACGVKGGARERRLGDGGGGGARLARKRLRLLDAVMEEPRLDIEVPKDSASPTAPPRRPDIRQVVFKMPQTLSVAFRRCLKTVQKAFARSLGPVILQMQKLSCYSHLYRYRRFRPRCGTGRPPPDPGPRHARPANVFQKRNIAAPNREQTMSITAA